MEDPSRVALAPRTVVSIWLGAAPPLAAGLATGGLAAALGSAFVIACPLLVASRARCPARAARFFPLYFVALFLVALLAFELNSVIFVVDTWSALLLALLTMPGAPRDWPPRRSVRAVEAITTSSSPRRRTLQRVPAGTGWLVMR